jgi:hypothetical protein
VGELAEFVHDQLILLAAPECGNPSMKSIETTCQDSLDTSKGDSNPGYLARSGLACKQVEHKATKALMSDFIPC